SRHHAPCGPQAFAHAAVAADSKVCSDIGRSFYSGQLGRTLLEDIARKGSQLTMQDLTSFQPEVVAALAMPLGDYTLYSPPPPAGGAILSLILNVLKGFNFSAESVAGPEGNVTLYHHLVETFKFAGGLRWRLWDPRSHPDVQVSFGAMVYSPRTGILLNNQLRCRDDSLASSSPTPSAPPHPQLPHILGSPRPSPPPHPHLPRSLRSGLGPVAMETGLRRPHLGPPSLPQEVKQGLERRGQEQAVRQFFLNVVQAVFQDGACVQAVSDPRKQGEAAGY
ncbi:PREDICTED: gamma-glutamyltransferase 5, partial [Myotis davidii]|uniref:gamma-glutamyltransferase 5 n=1 Tax=Myotis davidii TaxID=225400 RepID=UPI00076774B4